MRTLGSTDVECRDLFSRGHDLFSQLQLVRNLNGYRPTENILQVIRNTIAEMYERNPELSPRYHLVPACFITLRSRRTRRRAAFLLGRQIFLRLQSTSKIRSHFFLNEDESPGEQVNDMRITTARQ